MARNWNKFKFDELCHLWLRHKEKGQTSSLFHGTVSHSKFEISSDEMDELVDYLLQKINRIKENIDN